jgi:hypothetical protein
MTPTLRQGQADPRLARRLFFLLVLLTASLPLFMIADRRLPRGHQTRAAYERQYAFLAGSSEAGSIPLWMPFTAGGSDSGRELYSQAGALQHVLMAAGPALRGKNFLPLFHLGLFAEELLLLIGTWLLARRFFPSPATAFFVGVSALGSAFCFDQAGVNLQAIHGLPLELALLHGFLDTGSRRRLLLAGSLGCLQALGSPPGLMLLSPLVVLLYFGGRRLILGERVLDRIRELGWRKTDALVGLGLAALGVLVAGTLGSWGGAPARSEGGALSDLLSFAGLSNPLRYAEFWIGVNPSLDWSVYSGAFSAAFALIGILTFSRSTVLRLIVLVPLGLLALGAVLLLFQSCFPALRTEPAPPVGTPLVRMLVIFIAGAGFQEALDKRPRRPLVLAGTLLMGAFALLLVLTAGFALQIPSLEESLRVLVAGEPAASTASSFFEYSLTMERTGTSSPSGLVGATAMSMVLAAGVLFLWASRPRALPLALGLVFLLHPLDVFGWKFRHSWMSTFSANPTQQELQRLAPAPFPARRLASVQKSERYAAFHRRYPGRPTPIYAPRPAPGLQSPEYWFADVIGPGTPPAAAEKLRFTRGPAPGGERLALAPDVLEFTPNRLHVRVAAPPEGAWLVYADAAAPAWRATDNDAPREILETPDGAKAVRLDPGPHLLRFRYSAPGRSVCFFLLALNALGWLAWIVAFTIRACARDGGGA